MVSKYYQKIGKVFTVFLIILSFCVFYSIVKSSNTPEQLPSVFGYMSMTVITGSMEPMIKPGDLIIVKSNTRGNAKINDVITYKNENNTLITHRIVDLVVENGEILYQTKGDANNVVDRELVSAQQVVGQYKFHLPFMGYVVNFLKTPMGLLAFGCLTFLIITLGNLKNLRLKLRKQNSECE